MSCRRVFSNNKDLAYSNYYDKKKIIIKNSLNSYIYNKCNKYVSTCNRYDVPINIIEGSQSFYTNINDLSYNNCRECINSQNLCDDNNCNKTKYLYPHGIYIKKKYSKCKNIPNFYSYNSLTYDLNNIYGFNKFNNSFVSQINSYYNNYILNDDYSYGYYNGYYDNNGHIDNNGNIINHGHNHSHIHVHGHIY